MKNSFAVFNMAYVHIGSYPSLKDAEEVVKGLLTKYPKQKYYIYTLSYEHGAIIDFVVNKF